MRNGHKSLIASDKNRVSKVALGIYTFHVGLLHLLFASPQDKQTEVCRSSDSLLVADPTADPAAASHSDVPGRLARRFYLVLPTIYHPLNNAAPCTEAASLP